MIRISLTLSALLLSTSLANAASQAEDAFEAYVKDINKSGLFSIDTGSRTYDSGSDSLTVRDVVYKLEWNIPDDAEIPFALTGTVTIPSMHLKGVELADDGFSYHEWKLDAYSLDIKIDGEGEEFDNHLTGDSLGSLVTRDGFNPFMGEFKLSPTRPIGSTLDYIRPLVLKTGYKSSSSTGFAMTIKSGDGTIEKTTYGPSISTDLADGKIASIILESQSGTTSIPDTQNEDDQKIKVLNIPDAVTYEVGQTRYEHLDIAALLALFDPRMPGRDGKTAILKKSVNESISVSAGELFNFSVGESFQLNYEASRPARYLVPLLDTLIAEGKDMEDLPPEEADKLIAATFDLMRSFSFGRGEMNNLKFDLMLPKDDMVAEKIQGGIAQLAMNGLDKNGIKEYSMSGITFAGPDQVALTLGRAEIENLEFPAYSQIQKVITASLAAQDPASSDLAKIAPHKLTIALNDLDYRDHLSRQIKADEIHATYNTDGLAIPTEFTTRAKGLSISKDLISHPLASVLMNQLGLEALEIDKEITLAWNETDETYMLSPLDIKLGGIARLEGSIGFGGINRSYLDDPEKNGTGAIATGTVLPSSLSLSDEGGLPELINLAGGMTGMGPEQIRSFASAQIHAMLSAYTRPDFAQAVAGQVKAFLANPKRLEIVISPSAPVPLTQVLGVAATAPASIPDILGIGVFAVE